MSNIDHTASERLIPKQVNVGLIDEVACSIILRALEDWRAADVRLPGEADMAATLERRFTQLQQQLTK